MRHQYPSGPTSVDRWPLDLSQQNFHPGEYHFGAFFLAGDLKRIYREGSLILVEADAVLVENLTDVWQSLQHSMELTGKSFGDFLRGELDQLEARK